MNVGRIKIESGWDLTVSVFVGLVMWLPVTWFKTLEYRCISIVELFLANSI